MRLFLGSSGLGALPSFLGRDPSGLHMVFVPTAARHNDDKSFMEADRAVLRDMGFVLEDLELDEVSPREAERVVEAGDCLFVEGGSSFWLLQVMVETGFDRVVRDVVARGMPYVGMSAGAVVAGPDLEPVSELSDRSLGPRLRTTAALGLVEFVIIPHYNWPERAALVPRLLAEHGGQFRLLPLTDGQALVVDDDGPRIVRSE